MNFPKNGDKPPGRPPPPSMLADWANIDSESSITGMMGNTLDFTRNPYQHPPTDRRPPTPASHTTTTTNRTLPTTPTTDLPPPPPTPPTASPAPVLPQTTRVDTTPLPFMMEGVGASTVMDWRASAMAPPPPPPVPTPLVPPSPSTLTTPNPHTDNLFPLGGDTVLVCDSIQVSSVWGADSCFVETVTNSRQQPTPPPVLETGDGRANVVVQEGVLSAPPPSPKESMVLGLSDGTSTIADGLDQFSLTPFDESVIASIVDRVGRTVVLDFIATHTGSGLSSDSNTSRTNALTPVNPNTAPSASTTLSKHPSTKATSAPSRTQPQRTHHAPRADETTPPTSKLSSITPELVSNNVRPNHRTYAYLSNGGKRPRDVED